MTVIELLTDERRWAGKPPQTIPAPGQGCWSEGYGVGIPSSVHDPGEDPRRIWWDHVTEGHCPLCKGRLETCATPEHFGRIDDPGGWMHCWPCCWSVRMRTLP